MRLLFFQSRIINSSNLDLFVYLTQEHSLAVTFPVSQPALAQANAFHAIVTIHSQGPVKDACPYATHADQWLSILTIPSTSPWVYRPPSRNLRRKGPSQPGHLRRGHRLSWERQPTSLGDQRLDLWDNRGGTNCRHFVIYEFNLCQ